MTAKKKKAIFLDRDGTIIEDRGYLKSPSDVFFYPGAVRALRLLSAEYELFIVTNQVGVARKFISEYELSEVNKHITGFLRKNGIEIREVFSCIHDKKDGCRCRKPLPYFLHLASSKYDIDIGKSYVIGDHPSDVMTAENAGAKGIFILTGHGLEHRGDIGNGHTVMPDLLAAAEWILKADEGVSFRKDK